MQGTSDIRSARYKMEREIAAQTRLGGEHLAHWRFRYCPVLLSNLIPKLWIVNHDPAPFLCVRRIRGVARNLNTLQNDVPRHGTLEVETSSNGFRRRKKPVDVRHVVKGWGQFVSSSFVEPAVGSMRLLAPTARRPMYTSSIVGS